jgi:hypothetical protein
MNVSERLPEIHTHILLDWRDMSNRLLLTLVLLLVLGTTVFGQNTKGNINPNLRLTATERFRIEAWDNAETLNDSVNGVNTYSRNRTSLLAQWYPHKDFELALKLTNEFRYYLSPQNKDFNFGEVFFDLAYAKWNNTKAIPGTLTVGRQNITLGEGFIVSEGGPLDGSRSTYFNALRYDWQVKPKSTLTLFYVYQPMQDNALPLINDRHTPMVEQPEEALGLYFDGDIRKTSLELYYIFKHAEAGKNNLPVLKVTTVGARVGYPFTAKLAGTAEAAVQSGSRVWPDQTGLGGYTHLDYTTGWKPWLPAILTFGGVYLSGDDPETDDYEGWDPLFGRWPKWSESYIYTLKNEVGVARWTNYASLFARAEFKPAKDMRCLVEYQRLMAPQRAAVGDFPGGTGTTRGDLFVGRFHFRINKYLTGQVVWEELAPGDYYFAGADSYTWIRSELMLTIE